MFIITFRIITGSLYKYKRIIYNNDNKHYIKFNNLFLCMKNLLQICYIINNKILMYLNIWI